MRSARSGELIPLASLVTLSDFAGASTLNRFDRVRAITIEANLADGYPLGEALAYLQETADTILPEEVQTNLAGPSRDFQQASGATTFLLVLGAVVVFLVLAAQFESLIHPFVIMLTVPLAMSGALLALLLTGQSLNIYSQVGLVLLIGLAAKNGILIVEFANQLRDEGQAFRSALIEASVTRLRPILMTAVTTMAGAIPLIVSSGPGAESRLVIGTVIMAESAQPRCLRCSWCRWPTTCWHATQAPLAPSNGSWKKKLPMRRRPTTNRWLRPSARQPLLPSRQTTRAPKGALVVENRC